MPLAPRWGRTLDLAIGQRLEGPSSSTAPASGSTVTPPGGSCVASPARQGSPSALGLTRCDTRSSPRHSTPEFPCGTSKKQPATPTRAPPCATTEAASLSTVTPPTLWPHLSPAPRAERHRFGVRAREHVGARAPDRAICARQSDVASGCSERGSADRDGCGLSQAVVHRAGLLVDWGGSEPTHRRARRACPVRS